MKPYKVLKQIDIGKQVEISVYHVLGNLRVTRYQNKLYELSHVDDGKYSRLIDFKYKETAIDYLLALVKYIPELETHTYADLKILFARDCKVRTYVLIENYKRAKDKKVKDFPWFNETLVDDITPYLIEKKVKPQPVYEKMIVKGYKDGEPTETEVDILVKNNVLSILSIPYDSGTRYSLTHNHTRMSIGTYDSKVKARKAFKMFSGDQELMDFFDRHKTKDNMFKEAEMVGKVKLFLSTI